MTTRKTKNWTPKAKVAHIPRPNCMHKLTGYNIGHVTCAHCPVEWVWSDAGWKLTNY